MRLIWHILRKPFFSSRRGKCYYAYSVTEYVGLGGWNRYTHQKLLYPVLLWYRIQPRNRLSTLLQGWSWCVPINSSIFSIQSTSWSLPSPHNPLLHSSFLHDFPGKRLEPSPIVLFPDYCLYQIFHRKWHANVAFKFSPLVNPPRAVEQRPMLPGHIEFLENYVTQQL